MLGSEISITLQIDTQIGTEKQELATFDTKFFHPKATLCLVRSKLMVVTI